MYILIFPALMAGMWAVYFWGWGVLLLGLLFSPALFVVYAVVRSFVESLMDRPDTTPHPLHLDHGGASSDDSPVTRR